MIKMSSEQNITQQLSDSWQQNGSTEQGQGRSICSNGFYWPIHGPLVIFLVLISLANIIVVILVFCKEILRTLSNLFLASLALSDLIFGLIGIPIFMACSVGRSRIICMMSTFVVRFTAISSMFHLLLIASDRYAMIVFSLQYPTLVTKPRAIVAIVAIWFISLTSSFVQLSWYNINGNLQDVHEEDDVYITFILSFFFVPLFLMLYMYGHIFAISLHHILAVRRRRRDLNQPGTTIAHDLRGTFILASMLLIFVGCWLPFFLLVFQDHVSTKFFALTDWGLCIILYLRFVPPLTNPLLWAFCKQDFRRVFCRLTRYRKWPLKLRFRIPQYNVSYKERKETGSTLNETITERSNNAKESAATLTRISVEVLSS